MPSEPSALIPRGESAVAMKAEVAQQRAQIARTNAELTAQVEQSRRELEAARRAMDLEFAAKRAELEAKLGPLQAQMKQLQEMAWTVDLYLGRDEQIEMIRDGELAGVDEPIVLRQMVLAMDEECIALLDNGGVDARSAQTFFDWMVTSEDNLNRVMPDRKGIVVIRPTAKTKDYGDAWMSMAMEEPNAQSHWLIRNGDRVYVLVADIKVGDRLLPTRTEFIDFYYQRAGFGSAERKPMEPGSEMWLKAENAANARQRHYMRIMLILQGLADRTVTLSPLPPGGVNFLSVEAQDSGRVRIINELDNVLTTGRPSFAQWRASLNAKLRPGMRIIGSFGKSFDNTNERYDRDRLSTYRHSRIRPDSASHPVTGEIYLVEDRAPRGGLVIRYERSDRIYRDSYDHAGRWQGDGEAKVRASCVLFADDPFVLAYDLTTVEELQTYLDARTERHDYLEMVPVLRAAIAAKHAEAETEVPFMTMLAGVLAAEHGVDVADVEVELPELVRTWKLANRWARPLVSSNPVDDAKAVTGISKEFAARRRADTGTAARDAAALRTAASIEGCIAVARRRSGDYVAFTPSEPDGDVFLDQHRITARRGKIAEVRRWTILAGAHLAGLTMLRADVAWHSWNLRASRSEHLSGPQREAFAEKYLFSNAPGPAIALTHRVVVGNGESTGEFELYCWSGPTVPDQAAIAAADNLNSLMTVVRARWKIGAGGVVVAAGFQTREHGRRPYYVTDRDVHFTRYGSSSGTFRGEPRALGRPGLDPVSARKATARWNGAPTVLVWEDTDRIAEVERVDAEMTVAHTAAREINSQWYSRAQRVVLAVESAHQAALDSAAFARFCEDFGTDDPELWAHHKATLPKQKHPVRADQDVTSAVSLALRAGVDVVGMTLAQIVAEHKAGHWHARVPKELADVVIPASAVEPEGVEPDQT